LFSASPSIGTPLTFSLDTLYISIPLTILISLIIFVPTILKQKTYRLQGIALLALYVLDYVYLFATLGKLFG
jgi:Ca2+/Na+ antiporter